ncbi:hypothetical protein B0H19DRAFT_429752 [Mycena capillaripes]|nr:hypothetical protein B0H19DRAFT_429752 [Mycena capillaripes]
MRSMKKPHDWSLKCAAQISFAPLERNHLGKILSKILVRTVDRYQIREKAGWFTANNTSNKNTALKEFGHEVDPLQMRCDAEEGRAMYKSFPSQRQAQLTV